VWLYQTSLGIISYKEGNLRQAEAYLVSAKEIFARSNAQGELAKACLYLAQTYHAAGRSQEALDCVQAVAACLLELGYDQFLVPVARETMPVLKYVAAQGMNTALVRHLLQEVNAATISKAESLAAGETLALQPLLRVYAFGEGRVLKGDKLVTSAEWGMAKSKELFYYLLCYKQRRKDQISNDLWPELTTAKLRSSFHVALYRLRRALSRQDCVLYEDDQYCFNQHTNYWFDVEEFEKAIQNAQAAWPSDRAKAAECYQAAVALYQGDFMEDFASSHEWCLFKREDLLQQYLAAVKAANV